MSTGRWRVTGLHGAHEFLDWATGETRTEVCTRWGVTSPEGYDHEFFTHAEALAYADQQARTVTVELPPVVGNKCIDPDMSPAMFVEKTPTAYGIFLGHRHMVGVTPSELKPLGEYLLSLHYHHERNQK